MNQVACVSHVFDAQPLSLLRTQPLPTLPPRQHTTNIGVESGIAENQGIVPQTGDSPISSPSTLEAQIFQIEILRRNAVFAQAGYLACDSNTVRIKYRRIRQKDKHDNHKR